MYTSKYSTSLPLRIDARSHNLHIGRVILIYRKLANPGWRERNGVSGVWRWWNSEVEVEHIFWLGNSRSVSGMTFSDSKPPFEQVSVHRHWWNVDAMYLTKRKATMIGCPFQIHRPQRWKKCARLFPYGFKLTAASNWSTEYGGNRVWWLRWDCIIMNKKAVTSIICSFFPLHTQYWD